MKKNRPRIKIPLAPIDWMMEITAIVVLFIIVGITIASFGSLPDTIPTHFDISGEPDAYGSKNTLWLFPGICLFLYVLMTVISKYPHAFNYLVKITQENAEYQYRNALKMIRVLKVLILGFFLFIHIKVINATEGDSPGLGSWFSNIYLIIILLPVTIYLFRMFKNKKA